MISSAVVVSVRSSLYNRLIVLILSAPHHTGTHKHTQYVVYVAPIREDTTYSFLAPCIRCQSVFCSCFTLTALNLTCN